MRADKGRMDEMKHLEKKVSEEPYHAPHIKNHKNFPKNLKKKKILRRMFP